MTKPLLKKTRKAPEIVPEPTTGWLVGYARVSTAEQRLDLQIDALRRVGVREDNIHVEKTSAASKKRPGLELAIKDLRPGDTLVVWRLDRLARSMRDLYRRLDQINEAGAKFRSLTENFDFDTATGKFMLAILGAVAELERQLIAQRTKAGMQALKDRGVVLGAPKKMTPAVLAAAAKAIRAGESVSDVAERLKVSKPSIYSHFNIKHSHGKIVVTRKK